MTSIIINVIGLGAVTSSVDGSIPCDCYLSVDSKVLVNLFAIGYCCVICDSYISLRISLANTMRLCGGCISRSLSQQIAHASSEPDPPSYED
jgi:hypothetical protein